MYVCMYGVQIKIAPPLSYGAPFREWCWHSSRLPGPTHFDSIDIHTYIHTYIHTFINILRIQERINCFTTHASCKQAHIHGHPKIHTYIHKHLKVDIGHMVERQVVTCRGHSQHRDIVASPAYIHMYVCMYVCVYVCMYVCNGPGCKH